MKNGDQPINPTMTVSSKFTDGRLTPHYSGLSKREYFAAMAMQSMVAGQGAQMVADRDQRYPNESFADVVAMNSVEFADALLKQLEILNNG